MSEEIKPKKKRASRKTPISPANPDEIVTVKELGISRKEYTLEKQKLVIKYIREGMSQRDACLLSKIPPSSFAEWLESNPAFKEEMSAAESDFKLVHVRNIVEYAIANKDWKASLALLGRKFPAEWGQGIQAAAAQTTNNIQINSNSISLEAVQGLIQQLQSPPTPIAIDVDVEEDKDDE